MQTATDQNDCLALVRREGTPNGNNHSLYVAGLAPDFHARGWEFLGGYDRARGEWMGRSATLTISWGPTVPAYQVGNLIAWLESQGFSQTSSGLRERSFRKAGY